MTQHDELFILRTLNAQELLLCIHKSVSIDGDHDTYTLDFHAARSCRCCYVEFLNSVMSDAP